MPRAHIGRWCLQEVQVGKMNANRQLNLFDSAPLLHKRDKVLYMFIGDQAFTLLDHFMKPYEGMHPKRSCQRIFNYRLTGARCITENAFGILPVVFRVLHKPYCVNTGQSSTGW